MHPGRYLYFVERCRTSMSIVLCFSPVGDMWRTRLRQFPSLVNCCTIDWFTAWPDEALHAVAEQQLRSLDMDLPTKNSCIYMCRRRRNITREADWLFAKFDPV